VVLALSHRVGSLRMVGERSPGVYPRWHPDTPGAAPQRGTVAPPAVGGGRRRRAHVMGSAQPEEESMTPSETGHPATAAPPPRPARPRDSAATRRDLLTAARELFATTGYAGTTVRAIAERAGVNQALLFRHFGNKEALFAEAVAGLALELLHEGEPERLLDRTLTAMLDEESSGAELFFAALRSAGDADAVATVRDELGEGYGRAFAAQALASGPADAALRAELLLAWLLGIGLLRTVLRTPVLADAEPADVTGHVTRAAEVLLRG
jgi:AcrR family transcriptional regulator